MSTSDTLALFEHNASSYDRVNSIISLGLDSRWRHWVARQAVEQSGVRVLDAFSGTGLVGIEAATMGADVTLADISPQMLAVATTIASRRGVSVDIIPADLTQELRAFKDESFDAMTLVFGVRYLKDPSHVLRELSTLLKPGGKLIVLEFVLPQPGPISTLAAFYFFRILPHVASFLAGRHDLYDYLISSVKTIGHTKDLLAIVSRANLDILEVKHFGFGLVCGVVAVR